MAILGHFFKYRVLAISRLFNAENPYFSIDSTKFQHFLAF